MFPALRTLFVFLLACFGFCLGVATQSSANSQTVAVTPKKTSAKESKKELDLRYAVSSGSWSAATISLFNTWTTIDRTPGRHMSFYSPDRDKLIEVIETNVTLRVNGKVYETDLGAKHDAELGWAPDSSRFFVTWTETGELGPWHTQVYAVDDAGIREIPNIGEIAQKDFEHRVSRVSDPEGV